MFVRGEGKICPSKESGCGGGSVKDSTCGHRIGDGTYAIYESKMNKEEGGGGSRGG